MAENETNLMEEKGLTSTYTRAKAFFVFYSLFFTQKKKSTFKLQFNKSPFFG